MMRKYFKESFEQYFNRLKFKTLVKKLTVERMNEMTKEFINEIIGVKDKRKALRLIEPLKTIILCDRYNKGETVINGLDFSVFREVLQKFTTSARDEFM
jgi:hypothetical protein